MAFYGYNRLTYYGAFKNAAICPEFCSETFHIIADSKKVCLAHTRRLQNTP